MRRIIILMIGTLGLGLLAGCGGNPAEAQYKRHPRDFMRQVVACENRYQEIGQTALCRRTLRVNARLFSAP
jgi:hypothetical protein